MIKRVVWLAAGVAIGIIAVRQVSKIKAGTAGSSAAGASPAESGPGGLNRAVNQVTDSIADFAHAVRSGMQERETDLRAALGVEAVERPEAAGNPDSAQPRTGPPAR